MKYSYLFLLSIALLFGCSIEDRIERREDRITGTWVIDRASFDDDDSLFRNNVTDQFRGDRITFFPNYTLEYVTGDGRVFDGDWYIDALRDLDDDLEFTIDADFYDRRGRLAFRWLGTIDKLTGNNFNLTVAERGGTLRLKWDRL